MIQGWWWEKFGRRRKHPQPSPRGSSRRQRGRPLPSALEGVATPWLTAGILASHPVWALWRLLLYVDVRTRVEGWDLQVGLRAAGLAR